MAELNQWIDVNVVAPLVTESEEGEELTEETVEQVKKAIRTKVLESYKNGVKVGVAGAARRELQTTR